MPPGKCWNRQQLTLPSAGGSAICQGGLSRPGVGLGHWTGNATGILALPGEAVSPSSWKSLRSVLSLCHCRHGAQWLDYWAFICSASSYCAKSLQSCLTLCDPMNGSPPGSSVHGILQARILEWVAMLSSRGSSQPRDRTRIAYASCIGRQRHLLIQPVLTESLSYKPCARGLSCCQLGSGLRLRVVWPELCCLVR